MVLDRVVAHGPEITGSGWVRVAIGDEDRPLLPRLQADALVVANDLVDNKVGLAQSVHGNAPYRHIRQVIAGVVAEQTIGCDFAQPRVLEDEVWRERVRRRCV